MAKNKTLQQKFEDKPTKKKFANFSIWVVGLIISLAVGSSLIDKTIHITGLPFFVTVFAGWVVVIGAILSLVLDIFNN